MLALSHRGHHLDRPENTLEAFARALELGADGIETDVRLSRDGEAVLFHDRHVGGREVAALSAAELAAAAGHPVPTLEAALERFPGIFWNLEIKAPEAVPRTLAAVERRRGSHRFLISSFWHPAVAAFDHLEGVECGLLLASRPLSFDSFAALFPLDGRIWTAVWSWEALDPELLDQAVALGFDNYVYGVETPDEHRAAAGLPLAGVITDRLDYLRAAAGAMRP